MSLTALILTTGKTLDEYEQEIKQFIKDNNPVTIGVHNMAGRFVPDYHLFVSKKRYKEYGKKVHPASKLVLTTRMGGTLSLENKYPSSHGSIKIDGDKIVAEGASGGVVGAAYAIMLGADTVYMVGQDGYSDGAKHHYKEKENNWERLMEHESATKMILRDLNKYAKVRIITPTVYKEFYDEHILFDAHG